MRGEVEIWDGDKLLHKESNLLVDGAGELLADIMTVSPSLSGITDHATSSILDASNYTIQAISFGKDASAYQTNAHALDSRRNLLYYTTPSSQYWGDGSEPYWSEIYWPLATTEVCSTPTIVPPAKYENVPSGVAHVISVTDKSTTSEGFLQNNLAQQAIDPNKEWSVSGGQDNWFCTSVYIKSPNPKYPFYPYPFDSTVSSNMPVLTLNIWMQQGVTNEAISRSSINTRLASPEFATISSVNFGHLDDDRGLERGFSIDKWDEGGGILDAGNGWYRIWTSVLAPVSATYAFTSELYPAGSGIPPIGEASGGIYAYGFQLELGRWPTDLQFNNRHKANNWDLSGSVLNRDHSPGTTIDKGTVRVIPPYGTSSYVPTNYLSSPPNPASTRLEDWDTAILDTSSPLSGFSIGQNLNVIPYREQGDQIPNFLNLYPSNSAGRYTAFNVKEGQHFLDLRSVDSDAPTNYLDFSAMGSIGPQAYYLGCYPEGSSTGGSNWALVSSLDNSAAYPVNYVPSSSPYFVSGTYNSIVNEASSMDVSGFVNMIMSGSPGTTTGYAMSSTSSGLCVSGGIDVTNSGTVEYSMLLGSGDVGYSNLYGGIYNMGLWTIDMDKTLKAGNTPPYSFGPLNNPRKYKLFSTKHLTKNLGMINDFGVKPGSLNYTDLTIKWRLHFL